MQNLTIAQTLTMSSIEIAELVSSRHDKVKQSIERLAERGIIQLPPLGIVENINKLGLNQKTKVYEFSGESGKRDSIIVVAQLCPEFTARLVDRWQELEEQVARPALPENYIEALEELLVTKKSEAALMLVNKEQEAEIHDLKNLFKEGMTATQFCKMLNGVNTQQVNNWLADRNWLWNESKSGTRWRATSYARDKYLTEHQHQISVHGGDDFIRYQPVLLRKGAERIYDLYRRGKAPMKVTWDGNFTHQKQISVAS